MKPLRLAHLPTLAGLVAAMAATPAAASDVRSQYNLPFHIDTAPFSCGSDAAARAFPSRKTYAAKGSPIYLMGYFTNQSEPKLYACVADASKAGWTDDDDGFLAYPITVVPSVKYTPDFSRRVSAPGGYSDVSTCPGVIHLTGTVNWWMANDSKTTQFYGTSEKYPDVSWQVTVNGKTIDTLDLTPARYAATALAYNLKVDATGNYDVELHGSSKSPNVARVVDGASYKFSVQCPTAFSFRAL